MHVFIESFSRSPERATSQLRLTPLSVGLGSVPRLKFILWLVCGCVSFRDGTAGSLHCVILDPGIAHVHRFGDKSEGTELASLLTLIRYVRRLVLEILPAISPFVCGSGPFSKAFWFDSLSRFLIPVRVESLSAYMIDMLPVQASLFCSRLSHRLMIVCCLSSILLYCRPNRKM